MVLIDELLIRLKYSENMDFCEDLTNIQSILNYANEYIKPLNKIQFRGGKFSTPANSLANSNFKISPGNEPYIEDIVNKLLALFVKCKYFDAKTKKPKPEYTIQLRKITFFLILNTEATFKYDLINDHTISHLLNTLPQLPKCLLHACIWGLSLDQYFAECISYTPIWFAFQFIETVVESLKYADPYETLDRVDQLVRAIYVNIARSDFRQMDIVDQKIILNKYYDVTMDLLRHFYSPDAEKFQNFSKNKYRKYMGFVLKHLLEMILSCFKLYMNRPVLKSDPIDMNIYALMREREPLIDDHRNGYSDVVSDTLHRMNTTLLNSLQFNVMQVDCNAFMYWVEIDLDDEYTLQRAVGEVAHQVGQLINVNECFEHDVGEQLKSISIQPRTINEIIRQSTIGEMIEKLEKLANCDDINIPLWLDAFINQGDLVLGNTECLETLDMHVQTLSVAQVKRLILFAANADGDDGGYVEEKLIEICLNSFDHFNNNEIFELIQYSIDEQKQHFSYLQLDNFDQFLIEVFNRTTFAQNQKAYLKLLIQNPQLFYDKLFDEALTTELQMQHMMEILTATSSIFKNFIRTAIKDLFESKCETIESQSMYLLPKFIYHLFTIDVLQPKEFIVDTLYKEYLVNAMKNGNYSRILLIMTSLTLISVKHKFEGFCPPMLVVASQVLELCRWNVLTFSDESVAIVCRTIEFITAVLKVFLPTANDSEKEWVLSRVSTHSRKTRYYFQKLALKKNEPIKTFDAFLWPDDKQIENHQQGVKFLCEQIVRCTTKEMIWLAKSEHLLPCFWDAFHLITAIVERSKKNVEVNCLRYACNAFLPIIEVSAPGFKFNMKELKIICFFFQNSMLSVAQSDTERIEVFEKFSTFLIELSSFTFFDDFMANAQTIILNNIDKCENESKEQLREVLRPMIDALPDSETKTLISTKLD